MRANQQSVTLGFVPAHRGVFSIELAEKIRNHTIETLEKLGFGVVVPTADETKAGCVENLAEAEICAKKFRDHAVEGIIVGAMNFGDEQSAAWVVRQSRMEVPILIFGAQEEETLKPTTQRRDAFCGLLSIGEALRQINAKYTVAQRPIGLPTDPTFVQDIQWFAGVCRVINGLRQARYGLVGTRPEAFWTCRFDEKKLQRLGPTTVVTDLSEVLAGAKALKDSDPQVQSLLADFTRYADTSQVDSSSVLRSVKLECFVRRWIETNNLDGLAFQCWSSLQQNYGVCACSVLSRLNNEGIPCACESDIIGTLSMHACQLASGLPAGLADWNNLHNEDEQLVNLWHCGVFPAALANEPPKYMPHHILLESRLAAREDSQCVVDFMVKPAPVTLCRITQASDEPWKAVIVQGKIEDNSARTRGSHGWCRIQNLLPLYRNVLLRHFPHHVAFTETHVGSILWEALGYYLGMQVYHASQQVPGQYTPQLPF